MPAGRTESWVILLRAMELRVYPMEAVLSQGGDTLVDIAEGLNTGWGRSP